MIKFCIILITVTLVKAQLGSIDSAFTNFKAVYGKSYSSPVEEAYRKDVFANKLRSIQSFNSQSGNTYTKGINEMSDLTDEEVKQYTLGDFNPQGITERYGNSTPADIKIESRQSDSFDWRNQGAVTPVKHQGRCGSCWAFSVVGALEGMTKIKKGSLVSLSEQELVDCHKKNCQGEWPGYAFDYVEQNELSREDCYRYQSSDGSAKSCRKCSTGTTISGHSRVSGDNENELRRILTEVGPVSITMCWTRSCSDYRGGVYNDAGCNSNNCPGYHAVTLVGYGREGSSDFWLLKNSWGNRWGEQGYMKIIRGQNRCFIARYALYPDA